MKANQFLKELRALGVEVSHKTNHLLLKRGNKWTTVKRHPSQEISEISQGEDSKATRSEIKMSHPRGTGNRAGTL